jgi:hypothetical protein
MAATFEMYKYIGKDGLFGELVSSIGLKSIDSVVPAVYGVPRIAGDDQSDVQYYSVHVPQTEGQVAHSFESVFKIKLKTKPDNMLSGIRIYPKTKIDVDSADNGTVFPKVRIGFTTVFRQPTNAQSGIAIHDLSQYDKENPLYVTCGGVQGMDVIKNIPTVTYHVEYKDVGYGNVLFLNGEMQPDFPIVLGRNYDFIAEDSRVDMKFYRRNGVDITSSFTYAVVDGKKMWSIQVDKDSAFLNDNPDWFVYASGTVMNNGGKCIYVDLEVQDVVTKEIDVVSSMDEATNQRFYLFDGVRQPRFYFEPNTKYVLRNHDGLNNPMRFLTTNSPIANNINEIVVQGVTVDNGGTNDEVINIDPFMSRQLGEKVIGYQSVNNNGMGNLCDYLEPKVYRYNMDTVGAGVFNPLHCGETDYIYMQLEVPYGALPGNYIPDIEVEYDEH